MHRLWTVGLLAAASAGCGTPSRYPGEDGAISAARAAISDDATQLAASGDDATVVTRANNRILVTLNSTLGVPIGDVSIPYCVVLYETSEFSDVFAPCGPADVTLIRDTIESGGSLDADAVEAAPTTAPRPGDLRTWPESWLARLVEDGRQAEGLKEGLARCFAALDHDGRLVSIEATSVVATGPSAIETELTIRIKPSDGPEIEENASTAMRPGLDGKTRFLVECGGDDQETVPMHYSAVRGIGCDSNASAIWTPIEARILRYLPHAAAGIRPPYDEIDAMYRADGDWYTPVGGALTMNESDRVCVARLKAREDLMRQTAPIPAELEPRLTASVEVFRALRKAGRTFPAGLKPQEPTVAEDGTTTFVMVDSRCKAPTVEGCPRMVFTCPAEGTCTAKKEG